MKCLVFVRVLVFGFDYVPEGIRIRQITRVTFAVGFTNNDGAKPANENDPEKSVVDLRHL